MKSLTKNKQSRNVLEKLTEKYFAPASMESIRELTEGYFNMAYEIQLSDGRQVILKIAPQKGTRIMTYEKNIMFAEVSAMKMAKAAGHIPVSYTHLLRKAGVSGKQGGPDTGQRQNRICGRYYPESLFSLLLRSAQSDPEFL